MQSSLHVVIFPLHSCRCSNSVLLLKVAYHHQTLHHHIVGNVVVRIKYHYKQPRHCLSALSTLAQSKISALLVLHWGHGNVVVTLQPLPNTHHGAAIFWVDRQQHWYMMFDPVNDMLSLLCLPAPVTRAISPCMFSFGSSWLGMKDLTTSRTISHTTDMVAQM